MVDDQLEDGAEDVSGAPKKHLKLIVAAAGVVAVLGSGVSLYYFFFMRQGGGDRRAEVMIPKPPVFVDVPEVLVNLSSLPGERVQYLRVRIALEVRDQSLAGQILPAMPRVVDIFQTYMRELRASDLSGSVGLFRLKEELTRRVNVAIQPSQVNAVLFKEIVVQ